MPCAWQRPGGAHLPGGALDDLDAADELAFQLAALVCLRQRTLEQPRRRSNKHRLPNVKLSGSNHG